MIDHMNFVQNKDKDEKRNITFFLPLFLRVLSILSFRFRFFLRKTIYEKYFLCIFLVFGAMENNSQHKIFLILPKKLFNFRKMVFILKPVNHFSSLSFTFSKLMDQARTSPGIHEATVETRLGHHQDPLGTHREPTRPPRLCLDTAGTWSGYR
jgi:hypothetical protein